MPDLGPTEITLLVCAVGCVALRLLHAGALAWSVWLGLFAALFGVMFIDVAVGWPILLASIAIGWFVRRSAKTPAIRP